MLRQEAYRRGADEAILLRDEHLAEGSSSSIFGYRDHTAIAPPQSTEILPSITRQVVEELLNETGVPLNQSAMSIDELYGCEEIWVASSAREILPITRIDNRQVGTGQPGPVWATLYRAFQEAKKRHPRRDNQI